MYQLTKISTALLAIGLSTTIFIGQSVAATTENMTATDESTPSSTSNNVVNTSDSTSDSTNSTNSTIANESATNKSATNTPAMKATGSTVKDKSTDMSPE